MLQRAGDAKNVRSDLVSWNYFTEIIYYNGRFLLKYITQHKRKSGKIQLYGNSPKTEKYWENFVYSTKERNVRAGDAKNVGNDLVSWNYFTEIIYYNGRFLLKCITQHKSKIGKIRLYGNSPKTEKYWENIVYSTKERNVLNLFYRNLIMVKSPILYLSGGKVQKLRTKSRKTMNDETVSEGKMLIKRCTLM
jgi:hypothetical protein